MDRFIKIERKDCYELLNVSHITSVKAYKDQPEQIYITMAGESKRFLGMTLDEFRALLEDSKEGGEL